MKNDLENEVSKAHQREALLSADLRAARRHIQELEDDNNRLSGDRDRALAKDSQERSLEGQRRAALANEIADYKHRADNAERRAVAAEESATSALGEIEQYKVVVSNMERAIERALDSRQDKNDRELSELHNLMRELADAEVQKEEFSLREEAWKTERLDLKSEQIRLEKQLTEAEEAVWVLQKELASMKVESTSLRSENDTLRAELKHGRETLAQEMERSDTLRTSTSEKDKTKSRELEITLEAANTKTQALEREVRHLTQALQSAKDDVDSERQRASRIAADKDEFLERSRTETFNQIRELQEDLRGARQERDHAVQESNGKVRELQAFVQAKDLDIMRLQNEITVLREGGFSEAERQRELAAEAQRERERERERQREKERERERELERQREKERDLERDREREKEKERERERAREREWRQEMENERERLIQNREAQNQVIDKLLLARKSMEAEVEHARVEMTRVSAREGELQAAADAAKGKASESAQMLQAITAEKKSLLFRLEELAREGDSEKVGLQRRLDELLEEREAELAEREQEDRRIQALLAAKEEQVRLMRDESERKERERWDHIDSLIRDMSPPRGGRGASRSRLTPSRPGGDSSLQMKAKAVLEQHHQQQATGVHTFDTFGAGLRSPQTPATNAGPLNTSGTPRTDSGVHDGSRDL
eukprot:NODE_361_length_2175_cov_45.679210_g288_i0.p1 GENE.NODE_361_length_2175_cov_45.679210_g288_i0~~NODE_361_length_2175_cov_45.679210_g288_i0.p1  ORF type:complete len:681 (-),score=257.74 NODE_361_length_2175_cov_45.679210_g288_i0:132-2132(-)